MVRAHTHTSRVKIYIYCCSRNAWRGIQWHLAAQSKKSTVEENEDRFANAVNYYIGRIILWLKLFTQTRVEKNQIQFSASAIDWKKKFCAFTTLAIIVIIGDNVLV